MSQDEPLLETKKCRKCRVVKLLEGFYHNRALCIECYRENQSVAKKSLNGERSAVSSPIRGEPRSDVLDAIQRRITEALNAIDIHEGKLGEFQNNISSTNSNILRVEERMVDNDKSTSDDVALLSDEIYTLNKKISDMEEERNSDLMRINELELKLEKQSGQISEIFGILEDHIVKIEKNEKSIDVNKKDISRIDEDYDNLFKIVDKRIKQG